MPEVAAKGPDPPLFPSQSVSHGGGGENGHPHPEVLFPSPGPLVLTTHLPTWWNLLPGFQQWERLGALSEAYIDCGGEGGVSRSIKGSDLSVLTKLGWRGSLCPLRARPATVRPPGPSGRPCTSPWWLSLQLCLPFSFLPLPAQLWGHHPRGKS